MAETEENPSLPSNYVSILHLREIWLKEQERTRKESEEKERKSEQKAQEQFVPRGKLEEKHDRKSERVVQKRGYDSKSWSQFGSRRRYQTYVRVSAMSNPSSMKETCSESVEAEGEALVADYRNEKAAMEKKKKKKKRRKNSRAENAEMGRTSEENLKDENEIRETKCKIEKKMKNVGERRIDEMKDVVHKLSQISVETEGEAPVADHLNEKAVKKKKKWSRKTNSRAKKGEMESNSHKPEEKFKDENEIRETKCEIEKKNWPYRDTGEGNRNFRDHRNLHGRGVYKRRVRDDGMVWVRKDELSDGLIDGSRKSLNRKGTVDMVSTARFMEKSRREIPEFH